MKVLRLIITFLLTFGYYVFGQTNDGIVHTMCNKAVYYCENTVCDNYVIHVNVNGSYKECTSSHTEVGCTDKYDILYASFDGADSDSSHYDFKIFWRYAPLSLMDVNFHNDWFIRLGITPCKAGDTISQYLDSVPITGHGGGFRYAWGKPDTTYVMVFEYDTIINHSHTNTCGISNNFQLFGSGYYAFRKPVGNGDYLYAWLRLSYECDTIYPSENDILESVEQTIVVHDYAYCTIPNYPLRVGQTSPEWGVTENSKLFSLHPNPTTGTVSIILPDKNTTIRQIEIRNLLGTLALEKTNMQGNTIDVSSLPAGVYIVRVITTEGKEMFAKLVKK